MQDGRWHKLESLAILGASLIERPEQRWYDSHFARTAGQ
jgi:hypothetical protein